jgi:hypothetical protein
MANKPNIGQAVNFDDRMEVDTTFSPQPQHQSLSFKQDQGQYAQYPRAVAEALMHLEESQAQRVVSDGRQDPTDTYRVGHPSAHIRAQAQSQARAQDLLSKQGQNQDRSQAQTHAQGISSFVSLSEMVREKVMKGSGDPWVSAIPV